MYDADSSDDEGDDEDDDGPKEPKDRAAEYRKILEAERAGLKKARRMRRAGMMDEEAEEEEEEEAVRGLGDFGFGVPTAKADKDKDEEDDDADAEIREEDLEGIVDTYSDDEGDKTAQADYLLKEGKHREREELREMIRRVREGFGDERRGGRSGAARGNLRLDQLTAADRSSRTEARRLGLLNSDEEWSDDENGVGSKRKRGEGQEERLEDMDEEQLGALLAAEQRARHMNSSQRQHVSEESESEEEEDEATQAGNNEEDEEKLEKRMDKQWRKKARMRRMLAEASQDSQGPLGLLEEDQDSQAILSMLQCTNSRTGLKAQVKKRPLETYSGALDAADAELGMGMGRTRKQPRKQGDAADEALPAMERSLTFSGVLSVGYAGSAMAKQMQRKGSFLKRSGSCTTKTVAVAASKFAFFSEDTSSRTGFEEFAARGKAKAGGDAPGKRPPLSSSGVNTQQAQGLSKPPALKGRLWAGLGLAGQRSVSVP